MSLLDVEVPVHSVPKEMASSSGGSAFGNAAVDIEKLEREIAAHEAARKEKSILTGSMEPAESSQSRRTTSGRLQDVSLENSDVFDTLEEPVIDTIKRDVKAISAKFGQVLFPRVENREQLLRDWDLWGPLFICVTLALLLHHTSGGEAAPQFTQVFSISFFGSVVLTVNIKLLGGTISFFQSLCVVGYCLLPPTAAAFLCSLFFSGNYFMLRMLVTAIGFTWATYAAMGFLASTVSDKRRPLVVYPIFLFYFVVSWLIVLHS